MKVIGILGGMSWESTQSYYQMLNQQVKHKLGGLHSARVIINSLDFQPIEKMQHQGDWQGLATHLAEEAHKLQLAGADVLVIATNTMHKVAEQVQQAIDIPLLHIADATAEVLLEQSVQCVALLGTAFTMQQGFYKQKLIGRGLQVLVPDEQQQQLIHQVIYQELCLGKVLDSSRAQYLGIIQQLSELGAQGVILGCTEIGLLVQQQDTPVALFDTTQIHAQAAVDWALSQ